MAPPSAYVFDAYGTLFDVHSVIEAGRAVTPDPEVLSQLWRQKQLEYSWLRSLMDRYEDFWTVTEDALRFALRRLGIAAAPAQVNVLMDAYLTLACFPDVPGALARPVNVRLPVPTTASMEAVTVIAKSLTVPVAAVV